MGVCYVVTGLIYGRPRFKRDEAGYHSVLMMLTLAAVLFPLLEATLGSHPARTLFAGIAAHATLPLGRPPSAAFGLILGIAGHAVGWPVPCGGS